MTHLKFLHPNDISGMVKLKSLNFIPRQTISFVAVEDKPLLRRAWSGSHDPLFNFDACNHISVMAEAKVATFCMLAECIKC